MSLRGLGQQASMTLRLYFRNKMALIYGYIFPVIFLVTNVQSPTGEGA